jgi:hypothetical protein
MFSEVFMGAGLWHPGADALRAIREAIVKDPLAWKHASRSGLSHDEASLKRPPRGFDRDHPLIEDLKRLSLTTGAEFTERQACTPDFPARFVAACAGRDAADALSGQGARARVLTRPRSTSSSSECSLSASSSRTAWWPRCRLERGRQAERYAMEIAIRPAVSKVRAP